MSALAKGALGGLALLSISSAVAVKASRSATWNKNHPVATAWLEENNYSLKGDDKFADFNKDSNDTTHFGLGCYRVLFGGKNFRKIYKDNNETNTPITLADQNKDPLPDTSFFGDPKEPLLGCSTSLKRSSNTYDFELALRQGERGFVERISAHQDKIISQLVFYEKNIDPTKIKTDPYVHTFSLYRYIKQSHKNGEKNIYQWANPISKDGQDTWKGLDLASGNKEETTRYYAVWVNGKGGKNIFDSLGVKSNGKIFSSLVKPYHSSSNGGSISNFTLVSKDNSSSDNQPSTTAPLKHYSLSVLDSLIKDISKRKGHWTSVSSLCNSAKSLNDERIEIGELKQLSQYCYQTKPKQQP